MSISQYAAQTFKFQYCVFKSLRCELRLVNTTCLVILQTHKLLTVTSVHYIIDIMQAQNTQNYLMFSVIQYPTWCWISKTLTFLMLNNNIT